jgi:hypothetical protein
MVGVRNAKVSLYFFEDIYQRGGRRHIWPDRKTQTMRLSGPMVGILSQYYHRHLIQGSTVQSVKTVLAGRVKHFASHLFRRQKFCQLVHIRLTELFG